MYERVGASTIRIRTPEHAILIDPVVFEPADIVCVSHAHEDHFQPAAIDPKAIVIVPKIAGPWTRPVPSAVERLEMFQGDEREYGELLAQALRELPARATHARERIALLKECWDVMNPEMRRTVIAMLREPVERKSPDYLPPKHSGITDRRDNPRLARPGWIELAPWEAHRVGSTTITRVPANFAHGVTEQATFLVECPGLTLYDAVDAMEDEAVHSYLGRHYDIDVAFLPTSGRSFLRGTPWEYRHTMDRAAAERVATLLGAKKVEYFDDERPPLPADRFGTESFCDFLYGLVRLERPKIVVELGTGLGRSAFRMAQAARENGVGHVWTVDDFRAFHESPLDELSRRRDELGLRDWLTFVAQRIEDFHPPGPVDLLFADYGGPAPREWLAPRSSIVIHGAKEGGVVLHEPKEGPQSGGVWIKVGV